MIVKIDQLQSVAQAIVLYMKENKNVDEAKGLLLSGDLGAGKTTLVQHISRALGVLHLVPSPTFVIMRSYETADPDFSCLVHIDAYRIEKKEEIAPLKLTHVFSNPHALVCIEWPEKLEGSVPASSVSILLTVVSDTERELAVQGDLGERIARALQI